MLLPDGAKSLTIYALVYIQYYSVTDGQTDGFALTISHSACISMLTCDKTRNSAIADKPRDAFRGQSRSPNMVPFHMIGMVSC